ncbi:MAG TPA: helix-turn-helix domain-containing protein [bacterium]|nr:helix-turn-helix domain-containing protein [bacterium]
MADHSKEILDLFMQIGSRLRSAREEHGYTLQELSAHTRINQSFLEKIETGDLQGLPGMAFVKGFIRNYISVLQIQDPELDAALQQLDPPAGHPGATQLQASNPMVLDTEVARPSYVKMGLFALLAILILWVGFVLFRGSRPPEPVVSQPAATMPATPAAQGTPAATVPATQGTPAAATPASPGAAPAAPAPPPQASAASGPAGTARSGAVSGRNKLELTIRGLERTWVRLSIDRAPAIDVLMQPAETVAWEANQEFRLTIGKSNGVAVYLNGEEYPMPQEPNKLIPSLVLNKLTLLRLEN